MSNLDDFRVADAERPPRRVARRKTRELCFGETIDVEHLVPEAANGCWIGCDKGRYRQVVVLDTGSAFLNRLQSFGFNGKPDSQGAKSAQKGPTAGFLTLTSYIIP